MGGRVYDVLVIHQAGARRVDVLAFVTGHVDAFETGIFERVPRVLPFRRCHPSETFGRHGTSVLAALVGVIIGVGEFVERFDDCFAKKEQSVVVAQTRKEMFVRIL